MIHIGCLCDSKGIRVFEAHGFNRTGGTWECVGKGRPAGKRGQSEQRGEDMAGLHCRASKYRRIYMHTHVCVCACL